MSGQGHGLLPCTFSSSGLSWTHNHIRARLEENRNKHWTAHGLQPWSYLIFPGSSLLRLLLPQGFVLLLLSPVLCNSTIQGSLFLCRTGARLSVEHKGLGVLYTLSSPNSELLLGLGVSPLIKTNKTKQNYNLTRSTKIYYFSQLQSDWH